MRGGERGGGEKGDAKCFENQMLAYARAEHNAVDA